MEPQTSPVTNPSGFSWIVHPLLSWCPVGGWRRTKVPGESLILCPHAPLLKGSVVHVPTNCLSSKQLLHSANVQVQLPGDPGSNISLVGCLIMSNQTHYNHPRRALPHQSLPRHPSIQQQFISPAEDFHFQSAGICPLELTQGVDPIFKQTQGVDPSHC